MSPAVLEAVIRIYLTAVEEKAKRTPNASITSAGYGHLAGVFLALGDRLSALTASRLAVLHAEEAEDLGRAHMGILCHQIKTLSRELGLPVEEPRYLHQ